MDIALEMKKMVETLDRIAEEIPEELESSLWVALDRLSYILHTLERNLKQ